MRLVAVVGLAACLLAGCTDGAGELDPTATASPGASPGQSTDPPGPAATPTAAARTPGVPQVTEAGSVLDVIRSSDELASFTQVVDSFLAIGSRDGVFLQERGVTILAPRTIPDDLMAAVQADDQLMSRFIGEHLVVGDVAAADLRPAITVANGTIHRATRRGVGGQALVSRNLRASNGRVHIVEGPLATVAELADG